MTAAQVLQMNNDALARVLFGENAQTGTIRLVVLILAYVAIFGSLFWYLGQ